MISKLIKRGMSDESEKFPVNTAQALIADGKGLLAMDESLTTCNNRLAVYNIPQTPDNRRDYKELIVSTAGLGEYISGAILYEETARQLIKFVDVLNRACIIPEIKVDKWCHD